MARLFGKRQRDEDLNDTPWNLRTILVLVVILVCLSGLLAVASRSSAYRREYSGIVVEKWARYRETEQGSQPLFRLLVEDDQKARFVVDVDDNAYTKAEPGMKITKNYKGVVLLRVSTTTR